MPVRGRLALSGIHFEKKEYLTSFSSSQLVFTLLSDKPHVPITRQRRKKDGAMSEFLSPIIFEVHGNGAMF